MGTLESVSYLLAFDLDEDLRDRGCPACRARNRVGWEYLRSLMASDITDARVVEGLLHSGGLCREHLLLAVEVAEAESDQMGIAILADLLLGNAQRRVERRALAGWRRPRRLGRRTAPSRTPAGPCPACAAEDVVVDGYLDLLVADASRYLAGPLAGPERGLCLPHVLRALDRPQAATWSRAIVEAWASTARLCRSQLGELIRKRDHRYQHEPPGPEALSWRAAADWLVGARRSPPDHRRP
jgi:hypothetical protein